jgi:LysR family glycine cleavage system transcriptional activator
MEEAPDFHRDGVDIAIVAQPSGQARLTATSMPLVREEVFPVCSPSLLDADGGLAIEDLRRHRLLREDGLRDEDLNPLRPELDWDVWLTYLGLQGKEAQGPRFSHFGLALRAAIDGTGLLLGRSPMIDAELAVGRLVRPFGDIKMMAPTTFVATWPNALARDPRLVAMREFLLDESCGCELAAGPCGIPSSEWNQLERQD